MKGMHVTLLTDRCILVEPRVSLNPAEPDLYGKDLMAYMQKHHAKGLIYDLKGIPLIDKTYMNWLNYLNTLCCLNNTRLVVVNMQPTAAFGLSRLIETMPAFKTALDIRHAKNLIQI